MESEVCSSCTRILLDREDLVDENYVLLVMSAMGDEHMFI